MLANYHTHTPRCHHARGSEREYIEAAIAKGFTVLGFSDHVPQPYPEEFHSNIRMQMSEIGNYTSTLLTLREEYKDRIRILIGYEVEYSRRFFPDLIEELRKYPLDYLIQGQHFTPDEVEGIYVGFPVDDEKDLISYVDTTIEGMQTGLFSYLAHPDLVNYTGPDEIYCRHMKRIVEKALELHIPLEVNMYGFSDKRNYPCDRFWKMTSEMAADYLHTKGPDPASDKEPWVVMGCDAHHPDLIRHVEDVEGLPSFLRKYGIKITDNIIGIKDPN